MGTHPLAGEYTNRTIFLADGIQRLGNVLNSKEANSFKTTHIMGGGDSDWSLQELHALGVCKNGMLDSRSRLQFCREDLGICNSNADMWFPRQASSTTTSLRGSPAGTPMA